MIQKRDYREELISEGRWSSTYRKGDLLLKKYKYYEVEAVKREARASLVAAKNQIPTPAFLETVEENGQLINVFEFVKMKSVDASSVIKSPNRCLQLLKILNCLSHVKWDVDDNYWSNSLLPEFKNALSHLDIDPSKYFKYLEQLKPCVFIHGDFTCMNLGERNNGELIVYDFQHGSLGPKGWDIAYFAATIPFGICPYTLSDDEKKMAEVVAAIRYGRSIRKKLVEINSRKSIFYSWRTNNW